MPIIGRLYRSAVTYSFSGAGRDTLVPAALLHTCHERKERDAPRHHLRLQRVWTKEIIVYIIVIVAIVAVALYMRRGAMSR